MANEPLNELLRFYPVLRWIPFRHGFFKFWIEQFLRDLAVISLEHKRAMAD
jgi:hypothetical protein